MKSTTIKLCALLVAILIFISCLPVFAAAAYTKSYSKDSNSGTRGEICTTLDGTSAYLYYTGDYTYSNLLKLSSSSLKSSLHNLMTNTHRYVASYGDCRDYVWKTDCEKNDTTHATTLYTSHSMTESEWSPTWSCNREHVWPKSLGGDTTDKGGSDLHHIRPTDAGVNSLRANIPYGESNGYYEPSDNVKGDVARIILYVHVRWDSEWGATNVSSVFESVDILLEWCELDPVDTWEMGRNEVVQNIQGNRNVFIDYPEFAWQLFGKSVPENIITPSGSAITDNVPTPPSGGNNNEENTTETNNNQNGTNTPASPDGMIAKFDFGANSGALHNDGVEATGSYSCTDGDSTLTLTNLAKIFVNAKDAKGNSCIKVGAGSSVGTFSFSVGENVDKVIIYVAQYKVKNTTVSVNGTEYSISTSSNDGEYTSLTIDTSQNKTVTFATCTEATRCMINTIELWTAASETEIETTLPEVESTTPELETEASNTETSASESENTFGTTESASLETESNSIQAEVDGQSQTIPQSSGCSSTLVGGGAIIIVLYVGLFTSVHKKKDNM